MTAGPDWDAVHRLMVEREQAFAASGEPEGERLEKLLRDRAHALATRATTNRAARAALANALIVHASGERYGLPTGRLAGVLSFARCAAIPRAPRELIGVMAARGALWSVYDLPRLLGMAAEATDEAQVVLLRDARRRVALRVDGTDRIDAYAPDDLRRVEEDGAAALVAGVLPTGALLIDMEALWAHGAVVEAL